MTDRRHPRTRSSYGAIRQHRGPAGHIANQLKQVSVFDRLDLVRQSHKTAVDVVQLGPVEGKTQLFIAYPQSIPSRVLAQHQFVARSTHGLRRYDLIGGGILDHSILMDPGFMRECVPAYDRLVRLHVHASDFGQELAGGKQLLGHDRRLVGIVLSSYPHHHHQLFQRRVPGPFADTIDGALHLSSASFDCCQGVCHR